MIQSNPAAERAVLAGCFRYNSEAYYDICDIVRESTFTIDSNAVIWKCIRSIFDKDDTSAIDIPSIYAAASGLGLSHIFDKRNEVLHLQSIASFPVDIKNVRRFAGQISRLEVARLLDAQLSQAKERLGEITGDERLAHILGIAEDSIFNFSSLINQNETGPKKLGEDIVEYVQHLEDNPVDHIGISTGYSNFDFSIGGGLRGGTVNVIGARPKVGKTLLADNIGFHIAYNEKMPVLNLDTEMLRQDHQVRSLAMLSEVSINDVETGKFSFDPAKKNRVYGARDKLKEANYYHLCIGGCAFEEQLATMRRWLAKEVGLKPDGTANDCVIIYDYLKLMNDESIKNNIAEFQAIGFMMTGLHNFAIRYKIPILAFIQLNRDGITKESTDAAAQSDRVIWLCSNFSIYKKKSDEEIASDGPDNGNRKLVPLIARHGEGLDDKDYINMKMKGWCGKIEEGKLHSELQHNHGPNQPDKGFEVDDTGEDEIPFDDPT
jgi:replicative DNA helicase